MKLFRLLVLIPLLVSARALALDENYLPFDAVTTAEVESGGKVLPAGTRFVLIRLENDDQVVADVSRVGVVIMPLSKTDIATQTAALKAAGQPPMPRLLMFIGNKLAGGDPSWTKMLTMPVAQRFEDWILFYGRAGEADTKSAFAEAQAFYEKLAPARRERTALIFVEVDGDAAGIASLAAEYAPAFQALPGYLSGPYARSFAHVGAADRLPLFVRVGLSGRVLSRHSGVAGLADFLEGE